MFECGNIGALHIGENLGFYITTYPLKSRGLFKLEPLFVDDTNKIGSNVLPVKACSLLE